MTDSRFLFDLTTSRAYKGANPVGIVRTEREIGKALLSTNLNVEFFHFEVESRRILTITSREAAAILGVERGLHDHDPAQQLTISKTSSAAHRAETEELLIFLQQVRSRLTHQINLAQASSSQDLAAEEPIEFFDGDVLVSAGLLWDGDYLRSIYVEKQRVDLILIQVIYDIVPILMPEFCVPGMNVRFPKFILDAAWTADALYCISDNTLEDVKAYLGHHNLPTPSLHRIELGADLPQSKDLEPRFASKLKSGKFVIYVSTIEPRKNHMTLFHAWRRLYQTDRDVLIPLVIVGRQGWNSTDVIAMIKAAEHLYPDYIFFMTDVSDADLDWLYRNSLFTVYPSLYEGWGLPVAESLLRGKFCIAATTSSIPEVACGLAELIDPLDSTAWTAGIAHFLRHPKDVLERESEIKAKYLGTSWPTAMSRFVASLVGTVDHARAAAQHKLGS